MVNTNTLPIEPQFRFAPGAVRSVRVGEGAMDEAIAESFPASDPPAWNPGLARPIPTDAARNHAHAGRLSPRVATPVTGSPWVIDVSRPPKANRTAGQVFLSVVTVVGLALLAPLAVLAVGTPIAVAVRGLLELMLWVFGVQG